MEQDAFRPEVYPDVEAVLIELFGRVRYNLDAIHNELLGMNYQFNTTNGTTSDRPLASPLPRVNELLEELDELVRPFGHVPTSLKLFYKIVGSCNFQWDHTKINEIKWNYSDPIQIIALDDLLCYLKTEDWKDSIEEYFIEEDCAFLEFAPDVYHKDNVSGGPSYSVMLTKAPSIDSLLLNEPHNTTFINYLRICCDNCGFPGIALPERSNNYENFFDRVKPLLKRI